MATAFIRGSLPLSHIPRCRSSNINCYLSLPSFNLSKRICFCSSCCYYSKSRYFNLSFIKSDGTRLDSLSAVPDPRESGILDDDRRTDDPDGGQQQIKVGTEGELRDAESKGGLAAVLGAIPEGNSAVISACLVGLLTGISVVVFNNGVHEIRDFFWDGIPYRGASWLREEPVEVTWGRTVLVPVCGGLLVGMLTIVQESLEKRRAGGPGMLTTHAEQVLRPFIRSIAACITLGTGNSLGPEGPSVEIGSSVAKGVGTLFDKTGERKVSLAAAGSAAGISSG